MRPKLVQAKEARNTAQVLYQEAQQTTDDAAVLNKPKIQPTLPYHIFKPCSSIVVRLAETSTDNKA